MNVPLQITSRHFPPSDALNDAIRDEVEQLSKLYGRITRCHVVIEQPHQHQEKGKHFHVRLDISLPGTELVVGKDTGEKFTREDPYVAVADAFSALRRKLQEWVDRRRGDVKRHSLPVLDGDVT